MMLSTVHTPDGNSFRVGVIPKKEADSLEERYKDHKLDDSQLSLLGAPAYTMEDGSILYRQYYKSKAFVFPTLTDYQAAIRGNTYYETNIQEDDGDRFAVSFGLYPAKTNAFREQVLKEITGYEPFENREFYLLKDSSVIILRRRTPALSDGYWFASMKDFDYFYYILSGKERGPSM